MTYRTKITIWSRIGNTPITGRGRGFCDTLLCTEVECADPADAKAETDRLVQETPHGHYGHFSMPEHPNQNTRSGYTHGAL